MKFENFIRTRKNTGNSYFIRTCKNTGIRTCVTLPLNQTGVNNKSEFISVQNSKFHISVNKASSDKYFSCLLPRAKLITSTTFSTHKKIFNDHQAKERSYSSTSLK